MYILGDRMPQQAFATIIAQDCFPLFQKILKVEGHVGKISLVLHGTGGAIDAPWPLVNMIREFTDDFEVIVPRKALSAATLICLGSERIVMGPFSHISPVDPTGNFVNPEGKTEQFAIQDILGFIEFSRQKIGLTDRPGKVEILKALSKIDPKILGSINRTEALIRKLTKGFLMMRKTNRLSGRTTKRIVENLTVKNYSHQHLIGRREARDDIGFGPMIEFAAEKFSELVERLYERIDTDLDLSVNFDPRPLFQQSQGQPVGVKAVCAILQSEKLNYEGIRELAVIPPAQIQLMSFSWELI